MHHLFRTALLSAIFVCAGTQAFAAATQVNIADPVAATRVVRVDPGSRLAVQEVPPTTFFHHATLALAGGGGCVTIANTPAGKALVIRQLRLNVTAVSPGSTQTVFVYSSTGCSAGSEVGTVNPPTLGQTAVTFDPGLAIPHGSGLSVVVGGASITADAYVDGYTVSTSVVP